MIGKVEGDIKNIGILGVGGVGVFIYFQDDVDGIFNFVDVVFKFMIFGEIFRDNFIIDERKEYVFVCIDKGSFFFRFIVFKQGKMMVSLKDYFLGGSEGICSEWKFLVLEGDQVFLLGVVVQ